MDRGPHLSRKNKGAAKVGHPQTPSLDRREAAFSEFRLDRRREQEVEQFLGCGAMRGFLDDDGALLDG